MSIQAFGCWFNSAKLSCWACAEYVSSSPRMLVYNSAKLSCWACAVVLDRFLQSHPSEYLENKACTEIVLKLIVQLTPD